MYLQCISIFTKHDKELIVNELIQDCVILCPKSLVVNYRKPPTKYNILYYPDDLKSVEIIKFAIKELQDDIFIVNPNTYSMLSLSEKDKKKARLNEDELQSVIYETYLLSKKHGSKVWGFCEDAHYTNGDSFSPFDITGGFYRGCFGIDKDFEFPECKYGNDYSFFISCYNLFKYRKCLINNRYMFTTLLNDNRDFESYIKHINDCNKEDYVNYRNLFGSIVKRQTKMLVFKNMKISVNINTLKNPFEIKC